MKKQFLKVAEILSGNSKQQAFKKIINGKTTPQGFHSNLNVSTSHQSSEVIFHETGSDPSIQFVTLNRPKAYNALNLGMVREMTPKYEQISNNEENKVIVLKGAGDKAFCAGGDIKAIYETKDPKFFAEEYQLNYLIGTLYEKHQKVHVSLLNGITMGGGVGLSVQPNTIRIATEKTEFAMPETLIGFFCDVGGSYFLPRLEMTGLGMYLALTGSRLKAEECVSAGVATLFVPSDHLHDLEKFLIQLSKDSSVNKEMIIEEIKKKYPQNKYLTGERANHFAKNEKEISLFDPKENTSVHNILEALHKLNTKHAEHTLATLAKMSPTSLRVVHRQLRIGAVLGYKECFDMEYGMAKQMMLGHDFFEGVRAALVDKDKNPKWNPASIDQISKKDIDKYFESVSITSEKICAGNELA
ncbi:hypothetical protein ABK040_010029 [Willaertia magna]